MNHRFPSGPGVICVGIESGESPVENSVTTPAGVIRPIRRARFSVNQRLPSGPAVMSVGPAPSLIGNSVIVTADALGALASCTASATAATAHQARRITRRGPGP